MKIGIGTTTGVDREEVWIDLERLREGRLLVQGVSRSGKSWLLRRLCEQSWDGVQQIVVDLEGEYVTLAEVFGHVVVGVAELERAGARAVARATREARVSVVVDLSSADRARQAELATAFLRGLVEIEERHWKPAMVVVDEAHLLAPQGATTGTPEYLRKAAVAAVADIMARGSKRGLIAVVATHRITRISKSVVSEALNFCVGRTTLDRDVHRAAELLGVSAGQADLKLRRLKPGQFIMLGDAISETPLKVAVGDVESDHRGRTPELDPPPMLEPDEAEAVFAALPDAEEEEDVAAPARRGGRPAWSEEELRILRDGVAAGRPRVDIATELGRAVQTIHTKISGLGLKGPKPRRDDAWTEEEDEILRHGYAEGVARAAIRQRLPDPAKRSLSAIGYRAGELGLNKAPAPWTDDEVETLRRMIADGKRPNDVARALNRPRGGVNAMMTKHNITFLKIWQDEDYELLRRRHAEGARLIDVARELDRPYANVAAVSRRMGLSFAPAAQDRRQKGANKPQRISKRKLLELARAKHRVFQTTSGGCLVDGKYSYTLQQLVALVNRDRAAANERPVDLPAGEGGVPAGAKAPAPEAEKPEARPVPDRRGGVAVIEPLYEDDPRAAPGGRQG